MLRRLLGLLSILHGLRESPLARQILSFALWLVMVIGMSYTACEFVSPKSEKPDKPNRRPFFRRRRENEEHPPRVLPRKTTIEETPCDPARCC
ncbi:MAG: hypothetical protein M3Q42_11900 [Pseudomonadota bacterium]|nr:hypothetical protein [Pseudomonadota bacterium]